MACATLGLLMSDVASFIGKDDAMCVFNGGGLFACGALDDWRLSSERRSVDLMCVKLILDC
jgi:hypothetical protein